MPDASGERDPLYEELRAYEGRTMVENGTGKDPVNTPMIRHWCEAMGHPVPPDGSAPATMLQVWIMGGLSGHASGPGRTSAYDDLFGLLDAAGYRSIVATDCEQEYLAPLRPGQLISYNGVVESVSPRKTTALGTGYFLTTRADIRADGVLAGTHRFRVLKYAPAPRRPAPAAPTPARTRSTEAEAPTRSTEAEARTRSTEAEARTRSTEAEAPTRTDRPRRPRPVVNRDNAAYWQAIERDHQLLIQRCTGCGTLRLPWLPGCNACGSSEWDTLPAAGPGTVFSYVVMHHPPFPAFDPPYAVALVELAEGVRVLGNVIGVPYDKVRVGAPVVLDFQVVDDGLTVPVFRAAGTEAAG